MTLDNDTGHFPPSLPRKSYNPFESDDDTMDSSGLKPENVNAKADQAGFILETLDQSAVDLSWEEAVFGQPAADSGANGQMFTDKNVTECELPEIAVCHKENSCQSVKDIGIDEGVPIHDKTLLALIRKDDDVDAVESPKSKLKEEEVVSGQNPTLEFVDDDCLKINEVKLGSENRASVPADPASTNVETAQNENDSKQSEPEDGPDHDDTIEKKGNVASPDEVHNVVVQEPITEEAPSELSTENGEATPKPDKSPNEEKILPNFSKDEALQESESTSKKDKPDNTDPANPPCTQSMTRQEEPSTTNSAVSCLEPRNLGETSFSSNTSAPLPSSITFTGPVAYSGNISYRSESSAGSTRSFAFPILQTEWNSSPERMVRSDPRHMRKQKGWLQSLFCCRF